MDNLIQKKILESKEHAQAAEKSLKTSLFKRNADYDTAASEYQQAGMCSKIAKQFDKAIEYFQKSAECYISLKSLFNAAKQYEQVAFVANDAKKYDILFESVSKAGELFITNGTRDSAGLVLEKGANMLKPNDPEKAIQLYQRAIHVAEVEDKNHDVYTFLEHCITLSIRLEKFTDAIEFIRKILDVLNVIGSFEQINKYLLSLVIIHLTKDDWVSAKNEIENLKKKHGLAHDETAFTQANEILNAFDEKDEEIFTFKVKNFLSYAVDNEILKMAYKLTKVGEWNKNVKPKEIKPKAVEPQKQNHANSTVTSNNNNTGDASNQPVNNNEEEEDDVDLL